MNLFNIRTAAGIHVVIEQDGAILKIFLGLPGHGFIGLLRCADDQLVIERENGYLALRAGEAAVVLDDASAKRVAAHFGIAYA